MNNDWVDWVRWCLHGQSLEAIQSTVLHLLDLEQRSSHPVPIMIAKECTENGQAAGYAVMYPGSIAGLGHVRYEREVELSSQPPTDNSASVILARVVRNLCEQAIEQGAELVQAIVPLRADPDSASHAPRFHASRQDHDVAIAAVMQPVAHLVQMERINFELSAYSDWITRTTELQQSQLQFLPFEAIDAKSWHQLIEATYVETLDVPELNGCRSTVRTLEGYASMLEGSPRTWWVIQHEQQNIGCLLLSPLAGQQVELTYVGLIPASRGRNWAHGVMDFVEKWCMAQGATRLFLAVDLCNTPAIRLYQRWGFQVRGFVQAWMFFPSH
jgi:ribosomal protein S18 acetylase RimI-like enzyme